jgi:hypothetical protein
MLTRDHLLKLEPDTRAFTLVGAYMGYFALLELGINSAVVEILGLDALRSAIVTRNMSFDAKIKTLRTLVNMFVTDSAVAAQFDKNAKRARKCGETRNVIAHTPFRASPDSDGVQFFPVSAASKFEQPKMDWPIETFLSQIDEVNDLDNELRGIEKRMSMQRIAAALMKASDQADDNMSLSGLGGLFGLLPPSDETGANP